MLLLALVASACSSDAESEIQSSVDSVENSASTGDAEAGSSTGTTSTECADMIVLFEPYLEHVTIACDDDFLYVESDSLGDHEMMVGITAWNQQVPLPQPFSDGNVWRFPLEPSAADTPTATNGQGSVAMALNGVSIFDPTRQDGVYATERDPYLIGELDACAGHSGRADDYHYHAGPVCLEAENLADGGIVAIALDGYFVRSFTDPDGSAPADLDACNGHSHDDLGYHYHLTETVPYVLGCYHGVVDIDGAQPHTTPVRRGNGQPIAAEITAMYTDDDGSVTLEYTYLDEQRSMSWIAIDENCFTFTYLNPPTGEAFGTGSETVCRSADNVDAPPDPPAPPNGAHAVTDVPDTGDE